ncbi:MAG: hypothetical protein IPK26_25675 [Planctomycetes bacterium]|nr:hypothetical protein [Planctomycetota bacterium]
MCLVDTNAVPTFVRPGGGRLGHSAGVLRKPRNCAGPSSRHRRAGRRLPVLARCSTAAMGENGSEAVVFTPRGSLGSCAGRQSIRSEPMATVGSRLAVGSVWSGRLVAMVAYMVALVLAARMDLRAWETAMPCVSRLWILVAFLVVPAAISGGLTLVPDRRHRPEGPAAIGTALAVIVAGGLLLLGYACHSPWQDWTQWIQFSGSALLFVWLQMMTALPVLMVLARLLERRRQVQSHE